MGRPSTFPGSDRICNKGTNIPMPAISSKATMKINPNRPTNPIRVERSSSENIFFT